MEVVWNDTNAFTTLPSFLTNDKEFVLVVVKINALTLAYTSKEITSGPIVITEAFKQNFKSILLVESFKLMDNKDFVMNLIKIHGYLLTHASYKLQKDREIVIEAVKTCGWVLRYASDDLKTHILYLAKKQIGTEILYTKDLPTIYFYLKDFKKGEAIENDIKSHFE